jgi:hypothetical protein
VYDRKSVGAELAREDGGTFNTNVPDTPLSRAGSLPQGIEVLNQILCTTKKPVGVSLLAKTAAHSTSMWLTHRFREQARSYRGFVFELKFCVRQRTL